MGPSGLEFRIFIHLPVRIPNPIQSSDPDPLSLRAASAASLPHRRRDGLLPACCGAVTGPERWADAAALSISALPAPLLVSSAHTSIRVDDPAARRAAAWGLDAGSGGNV